MIVGVFAWETDFLSPTNVHSARWKFACCRFNSYLKMMLYLYGMFRDCTVWVTPYDPSGCHYFFVVVEGNITSELCEVCSFTQATFHSV